ncbi:plant UBX domain-containing protein 10-like isoform X1 [Tasmannia lanceolata]|uniref:plant UBX domain-containing protein 10-like isoform X1 n=1 Tax=Tasmannia lanceolata TaxID=3420 RepID=UPI004062DE89
MTTQENMRAEESSARNRFVRRIVNLPTSIIDGVSRAIGHGMTLIGVGRRNQKVQFQQSRDAPLAPEEWVFLTSFEQQYGFSHPFFYACPFVKALNIAKEESKFLFIYLHSPEHPYTAQFCRKTLCSELVVQFLDANFVSWGAIASIGEGWQMTAALRAASFPFCAIIVLSDGNSIAVLRQVEGPVSPAELVEMLQRTIEEQGFAFRTATTAESEMRGTYHQLRQEQDAAYHAALQMDKEKDRIREMETTTAVQIQKPAKAWKADIEKPKRNHATIKQSGSKTISTAKETEQKETTDPKKDLSVTQIQIRFPNGTRKEQSFLCSDKIQSLYRYIDSLDLPGIGSYQLISNFPRRVYGLEHMGTTLKDARLHPRASLFLELVQ